HSGAVHAGRVAAPDVGGDLGDHRLVQRQPGDELPGRLPAADPGLLPDDRLPLAGRVEPAAINFLAAGTNPATASSTFPAAAGSNSALDGMDTPATGTSSATASTTATSNSASATTGTAAAGSI